MTALRSDSGHLIYAPLVRVRMSRRAADTADTDAANRVEETE